MLASLKEFQAAHPKLAEAAEAVTRSGAVRADAKTGLYNVGLLKKAAEVKAMEGAIRSNGLSVSSEAFTRREQYAGVAGPLGIELR